jgi:plasmid maintenance system antidote protein VapI
MSYKLGECLLLQRIENKGWSQAEFARKMKVSRQYINKLVAGKSKMSLEFAINASHLLECHVVDFYVLEYVRSGKE